MNKSMSNNDKLDLSVIRTRSYC